MSETPLIRLVRRTMFSAAVRYSTTSESKSSKATNHYGGLSRLKGLGFNYRLEAYFEGEVDPLTGMIINLVDIDRFLKELTDQLDHRVLNDLPIFKGMVPTAERIALFCLRELQRLLNDSGLKGRVVKVRLHEGDGFWVDAFIN